MSPTVIPRSTLNAEVVARLRREIIEGTWRPGARLQERLLCERFGISRSPLREAYQVLAAEGLVDISPNRGAVVSAPSPAVILDNYVLLRTLEVLAADLACAQASDAELQNINSANLAMKKAGSKKDLMSFLHANNEVHRSVVAATHNQPLIDAHTLTSRQIIRVQNLEGPLEHTIAESINEHDEFLSALLGRDRRASVRLFQRHLKTVEDNLRLRLEPYSSKVTQTSRQGSSPIKVAVS